jgi:hypothetical protein
MGPMRKGQNRQTLTYFWLPLLQYVYRRRLPVVMTHLKMSESVKDAVTLIEQGRMFLSLPSLSSFLLATLWPSSVCRVLPRLTLCGFSFFCGWTSIFFLPQMCVSGPSV